MTFLLLLGVGRRNPPFWPPRSSLWRFCSLGNGITTCSEPFVLLLPLRGLLARISATCADGLADGSRPSSVWGDGWFLRFVYVGTEQRCTRVYPEGVGLEEGSTLPPLSPAGPGGSCAALALRDGRLTGGGRVGWRRWAVLSQACALSSVPTRLGDTSIWPLHRDSLRGCLLAVSVSLPPCHSRAEAEWVSGQRK